MAEEISISKHMNRFHKSFLVDILKNGGHMVLNKWKEPSMPMVGYAMMEAYIKLDNYDKTSEVYQISLTQDGRKLADKFYRERENN